MMMPGHIEKNAIIPEKRVDVPDGTKVTIVIYQDNNSNSTGLCGIWKDTRPVEEICRDVISARSKGREVQL